MSELYSSSERVIIFIVLFIVALAISFYYLVTRVDCRQTSPILFLISLIYASAFVYLNLLAVYDLTFAHYNGLKKLVKAIAIYYKVFNWIDKAFGFVIFNLVIYYLESGHFEMKKKLLDMLFRILRKIKKMSKCKKIGILVGVIPVLIIILIFLAVYRKNFGLGKNPMEYINVILDCIAIFEIYAGVGFFYYQYIKDYKMKKDGDLMKRYLIYTMVKIVEELDKSFGKMKKAYESLNKGILALAANKGDPYYHYLKDTLQDIKDKMKSLGREGINPDFENNLNKNIEINDNNLELPNDIKIDNYYNIYSRTNNKSNQEVTVKESERVEEDDKKTDKREEEEEKEEEDMPTCIRKYKKAVRKITRLKKLYQETKMEKESDNRPKRCPGAYKLLFIPFGIAILTDFVLPLIFDGITPLGDNDYEHEKSESNLGLAVEIILSVPIAALCCSYTIITVYSTTRRKYISGDFLYDKEISDNLSLMKTVQIVCGYSFALVYCKLYLWKMIDKTGDFYGQPGFYGETIIPDYILKQGISIFMIIKMILIAATIIISLYFSHFFIFKNDLAEYNLSGDYSVYDNENVLYTLLEKKTNIDNFLKS